MDEGVGGAAATPPAHLAMVCSVWGTTLSSLRSELSSTASWGSTVRRACPTAATVAFHFHRVGDLSMNSSSRPVQAVAAECMIRRQLTQQMPVRWLAYLSSLANLGVVRGCTPGGAWPLYLCSSARTCTSKDRECPQPPGARSRLSRISQPGKCVTLQCSSPRLAAASKTPMVVT